MSGSQASTSQGERPSHWGILIAACLVSIPAFVLAFVAAGAGHGTFVPLLLLQPWGPAAALAAGRSDAVGVTVALVEWPVYGLILQLACNRDRLKLGVLAVAAIHLVSIVLALPAV
jgi:hypothetical protein